MRTLILTLSTLLLLTTPIANADQATIAVATNFKPVLEKLIPLFETTHPHQIRFSSASSGVLYNQLQHGAPFHAFLSADSQRPSLLEQSGLGVANSRFTYAQGQLALAFAGADMIAAVIGELPFQQALLNSQGKIAIANPNTAPYGVAAQETLNYLNMWQKVEKRLVRGANVGQSYQFVDTGNVALGFVALSQLRLAAQPVAYWIVPETWHQPIQQQAILLQSGQHNQAAIAFLAFLRSAESIALITDMGYLAPPQ